MTRRLIIRNGKFAVDYLPPMGDLLIEDERIVGVLAPYTDVWPDADIIDATGKFVLPGLVDAHTHIQLDTGIYQTDDNWDISTKVAAYGGITTVIDFATQYPNMGFKEALERRMKEAKTAHIDYSFHMIVTTPPKPGHEMPFKYDIGWLVDQGITSVKLFTTYRPNYYLDDDALLSIFYSLIPGMVAMVHCENDTIVSAETQRLVSGGFTNWSYHPNSRPPEAEYEAAARVVMLADLAQTAIPYIVHCSWAPTIRNLVRLREKEYPVYFETCPQYFTLNSDVYLGATPEAYIMQPPLRDFDSVALMERLFPLADVIATDHCDYSLAKKQAINDFTQTPGGIPGLETSLQLTFSAYKSALQKMRMMPMLSSLMQDLAVEEGFMRTSPILDMLGDREILSMIVKQMSEKPAQIFGLFPQKGSLMPGSDADVVIFNPDSKTTLKATKMHHIGGYSPYDGLRVAGKIETTISRGQILLQKGRFKGDAGRGRFVPALLSPLDGLDMNIIDDFD